ncbi:MAG TPA: carboxypeptidase-like regulatory domain-containing protein, partial [Acidobacteriaceae bacterium]
MQAVKKRGSGAAQIARLLSQRVWIVCLSVLMFAGAPLASLAQTSSGSITGTVQDKSGAVIPNADVTLINVQTQDQRKTQSNGSGSFFFAAVPVGTYKVSITASGFSTFTATDIIMHSGESHVIPDIQLPVLTANTNMEVTASQAAVIPLDNGASSTTLNEVLVDKLEIQGRDAAELVKFMPAMAMNTGLGQSSFSSQLTATNRGPIGQFSSAGTQPYGSMQMTLDGASLVDVGNQGTQIANVNQDSTKEFTFLNAAFGADTPRGPTVIQITSKSGGQSFHGDAYVYARNWQANANDAYFRENNQARPGEHQTYVGGTLGGPVVLPHVNFNRNRDKLFFFAAYEKMFQNPFPTLHKTVTPTSDWINGNFSADTIKPFLLADGSNSWWPTLQVPCANAPSWTSYCPSGGANPLPGGQISDVQMDPDGKALLSYLNKVNAPNVDPATHGGYNFYYLDNSPVNRWEARGRGDYDPTENDKISVVYTKQNEADINKFCVWWCPGDTGLSPSPLNATTKADLWTVNYTRVIGTSMTNELSFFRTYFTFPPAFTNPAAMNVSAAGYTTSAPFGVPS